MGQRRQQTHTWKRLQDFPAGILHFYKAAQENIVILHYYDEYTVKLHEKCWLRLMGEDT